MNLKSLKLGLFTGVFALTALSVNAQQQKQTEHSNANVRMGQKALLDGDFKNAESYLTKALPQEGKDPDVLYMLGYSQFQNGDYKKSAETFGKVVALSPKNANALYFKAKANNNLAVQSNNKISVANKEQLLRLAIEDYSKAIAITSTDPKFYQNRAIANRDLGILTGTAGTPNYNKAMATDAYNNAIKDYEKVLSFDASKKDIQTEIKKAKVYRDNLK
ncbi:MULTISPECIES: tetratricopeptide repeat protein [Sphingobacterium]|uniref:tetratricopeptide repeat protein n=1 Tax=Sphingobacterium TaxID=28453 RepID=UPI002243DD4E|nr:MULTISPECIES: tetratricopeptide repeat protein [Sphingobacterium]MCW8313589.1 tetratricopeptide repeat protein [Sphingobacterium sp. InxBP1]